MKQGFGNSSEKNTCVFCGKSTHDYMEYSENSIDVKFWCHFECRKDLSQKLKPLLKLLKQSTRKL